MRQDEVHLAALRSLCFERKSAHAFLVFCRDVKTKTDDKEVKEYSSEWQRGQEGVGDGGHATLSATAAPDLVLWRIDNLEPFDPSFVLDKVHAPTRP